MVRKENHEGLRVSLNIQFGNKICPDLWNKSILLKQCWKRFCTIGSVALWSDTKI
jgi:hypothetical protein